MLVFELGLELQDEETVLSILDNSDNLGLVKTKFPVGKILSTLLGADLLGETGIFSNRKVVFGSEVIIGIWLVAATWGIGKVGPGGIGTLCRGVKGTVTGLFPFEGGV